MEIIKNEKKKDRFGILNALGFFVYWVVFGVIIFFIFLFTNQDTADTSLMFGIALIPAFIFYKYRNKKVVTDDLENKRIK